MTSKTIHIARDVQMDTDGQLHIEAGLYDGQPLHVFCEGPGFSNPSAGAAHVSRPVADFEAGTIVSNGGGQYYRKYICTGISRPYNVTVALHSVDEDYSNDGLRPTGQTRMELRQKIYLQRIS